MKLVALWVEEYGNLKNQTFNLDHPYEFRFEFDKTKRIVRISQNEKKGYIQIFDNPIISVTALIGKNGVGKSTFLRLLNVINARKPLELPVILVFENLDNDNLLEYEIYVYRHDGFLFDSNKKRNIEINLDTNLKELQEQKKLEIKDQINNIPFENIGLLNYDSLYSDQNDKYLNKKDHLNRKTQYQTLLSLNYESVKRYLAVFDNKKQAFSEESFNVLKLFFDGQLERKLAFLSEIYSKENPAQDLLNKINLPDEISIWFENSLLQKHQEEKGNDRLLNKLNDFNLFGITNVNNDKNYKSAFKKRVLIQAFNQITYIARHSDKGNSLLQKFEIFLTNNTLNNDIFNSLKELLLDETELNDLFIIYGFDQLLKDFDSIVDKLEISHDVISLFGLSPVYEMKIDENTWGLIKNLLRVHFTGDGDFFNYSFKNLSAGEEALLNQYTELYNGIKLNKNKSLLIAIDEGEINLHGEWQREYLQGITELIKHFTPDATKIQLILTSHSPFVISDLTKYNVIFMNYVDSNNKNGYSVDPNLKLETFGANIFDIYSNSFFMSKGFIGEFAKQKIDSVFTDLNEKIKNRQDFTPERKNEIEKIIGVIGEPLMKRQLSKMFDQIFSTELEIEVIDEQIKRLEKLKKQKLER